MRARPARPSFRRLLAVLLATFGALVAALLVVTTLQLRGAGAQAAAESRRAESILLADGVRQDSDDLTRMARMYAATGQPRYRRYHGEILAIRAGTAPRPRRYDRSFWDRVLARGPDHVAYGPPESLTRRMRAADLSPGEFAALAAAQRASNRLARREVAVMRRVAARPGGDRGGVPATAPYRALADAAYLRRKGEIMAAVDRSIALANARTLRDVADVRATNRVLFVAQLIILALMVVAGIAALLALGRVALRPLGELATATRRIAGGHYAERARIRAVAELEGVADAFNEMADAVEADIAAREAAEREARAARRVAERADRAKSTFLAAMSHEIRTPLVGITGMLDVLARTELTVAQRGMIGTVRSSARALFQITGDTLDIARIEAGKLELAPTTFALRPLVGGVVEMFARAAAAEGLAVTWTADPEVAPAHVGDPLRLRQIVSNLLSNAVKFTATGAVAVAIRAVDRSPAAQAVEISVADTGVGIPTAQQAGLFEDFVQVDATAGPRPGGSGLGLAICRRLATLMGGQVTLESVEGVGTTARLTVPLPVGDPAACAADPPAGAGPAPAARHRPHREGAARDTGLLLVVDDHPVNRAVLTQQLATIGLGAHTAADGREALERLAAGRYALVLTDLNMPRLDGQGLARAIRRREAATGAPRTPVIALTATVMPGDHERCRRAGVDALAATPLTIAQLAAALRPLLPHRDRTAPAATGHPAAAWDGFDAAALRRLAGDDAAVAAAVVGDFVGTSRDDLRGLRAAAAAGDRERLRRIAHRIAGASRLVGATEVAALAHRLEEAAAGPDADAAGTGALVALLDAALAGIVDGHHAAPTSGGPAMPGG